MKLKQIIKRTIIYLLLGVVVIVVAGSISVYVYKDRIIQQFVQEANKQLSTPVKVGRIDISIADHFPYLAINFDEVVVQESYSWSNAPLLKADKISFSLNPFQLLQEQYTVYQLHISNAEIHLKINRQGENNFSVIKKKDKSQGSVFDLNKITLHNVRVYYKNRQSDKYFDIQSKSAKASLNADGHIFDIKASGDVLSHSITLNGKEYLQNKQLLANASIVYDHAKKMVRHSAFVYCLPKIRIHCQRFLWLEDE